MKRFLVFVLALFMFGACNAATLNIKHNNTTKRITLDTTKPTAPALAVRVGNKTMYAAMARATTPKSGGMYVKYNNQTYHILETLPESKFQITTTTTTNNFSFTMSAMGTFYVNWGDGVIDEIVRTNTTETTYSHAYTTSDARTIKIGGRATGYSTDDDSAAIRFYENKNVAAIDGSLGAIFPTLGTTNGNQPRFYRFCKYCSNLGGTIPENLFAGIYGQPVNSMFNSVFYGTQIGGTIPENLFAGISGTPTYGLFDSVFSGCKNLTGQIPEKLFAGIKGAPAQNMFTWTFNNSGVTGEIPAKLFSGISGTPAIGMYAGTFYMCAGLTGTIPDGLFGDVSGAPAQGMFSWTFEGCTKMTGSTARTLDGVRLYDIKYNGETWQSLDAKQSSWSTRYFNSTYSNSGIHD